MKYQDKPMMSDAEIKLIDDLISKHKPKYCLEWGSGGSTVHFPKNIGIETWLSVEHNGHYVQYLEDKVNPKVQIHQISLKGGNVTCRLVNTALSD